MTTERASEAFNKKISNYMRVYEKLMRLYKKQEKPWKRCGKN